jgi:hypothetical protein
VYLTYQRGKRTTSAVAPHFDMDVCFTLTKELCEKLESVIPLVQKQKKDKPANIPQFVSLVSVDQLMLMINGFIEKIQVQEIIQNSFLKVVSQISRNTSLLDIIDEDVEQNNNLTDRNDTICIKLIIILRYLFAVYQVIHPWLKDGVPEETALCSYNQIKLMKDYIEEQRFSKLESNISVATISAQIRTKCIQLVHNLFNKCQFSEDADMMTPLSDILLYIFGDDLSSTIVSARSKQSKDSARTQTTFSFKDLTVYIAIHLDKEVQNGCSPEHYSSCLKLMTALATIHPPNKELSSTSSAMPLVNHITTKRSQTLHKTCKILEKILKEYVITHPTLIKASLTFMLTFSQTERALERCSQIITTCHNKYHGKSPKNQMNICEKDNCTIDSVQCVLTYFETLLVSSSNQEKGESKLKKIEEESSTDKSMENIGQILETLEKTIEMIFEDETTKKLFQKMKTFQTLEKKIENLLCKLCRFTINNSKTMRQEITRAAKKSVKKNDTNNMRALVKLLTRRTANYYSICKLLSRMQYYKGSILTSDDREYFSDKYANLITNCEKLSVEIRSLFDKFSTIQKTFTGLSQIPLLEKLATTEMELLIHDEVLDNNNEEDEEDEDSDQEATKPGSKQQMKEALQRQKSILQKRKRLLEEQAQSGERLHKKQKSTARSRNPFIDYAMAVTNENHDNYADLEDFIDVDSWTPPVI